MRERSRAAPTRLTGAGPTPSIGLLVDLLDDSPYQWAILQGAMDSARDRGAHLLCFAGGVLGLPSGETSERNTVFEFARPKNVDALILLSGSIGKRVGGAGLREFAARFAPLPMCSIGVELEGMSNVSVDNDAGMRSAMTHMLRSHGVSRIAFVRGPEGNAEAEQRFRVYKEALAAAGIPLDPQLVVLGDFEHASGKRAVDVLFDERKQRLEDIGAIVAANDLMALGVLDELGHRGIPVPEKIAVIGFDDVEESRVASPPLTTVRQPLYEQGRDAVRLVLDQLRNGAEREGVVHETELVARRSCGCTSGRSATVRLSDAPGVRRAFDAALLGRRQEVLTDMLRASHGQLGAAGAGWEERLLNAFADQLRGSGSESFTRAYENLLRRLSRDDIDVAICNDVISAMRAKLLRMLSSDPPRQVAAENLFHEARVTTAQVIERMQSWRRIRAWRSARALGRAAAAIAAGAEMGALAHAVRETLPGLGIPRCFLAEYCEGPGNTRMARIVLAMRPESSNDASAPSSPAPLADILRTHVLPSRGEHAFAIMPVTSGGQGRGILVLELGAPEGYLYETLREVFAAALSGRRSAA